MYAHLPLVGVSHHNVSALLVVLSNAHLGHIFRPFDPQCLVNLILLQKHTGRETQAVNKLNIHRAVNYIHEGKIVPQAGRDSPSQSAGPHGSRSGGQSE